MVIEYPTHMRGLCYFFLLILIQASLCTIKVIGRTGQNVSLPCTYDAKTYGVLSFCWGQGKVPMSKCSNTILSLNDGGVLYQQSPRYQLLGWVTEGDLSLTILNAQKSDAGMYGCRVEIPGLFNDHKANTHLVMEEVPTTSAMETRGFIDAKLEKVQTETNQEVSIAFLGMGIGNIGRIAAIFCLSVIVILVLVIRRTILSRGTLPHPTTLPTENIYESV
ncbi:hepatitis A virus cellular receptor 1 homolog isoform X2 [Melanotaenia boesemani]|uniref:hepatitis A virus cellular receptor 1 homolog isoform X2 n=1 Tax=Melanotaenia boesemani TaxID=1250792 RepID=UPI001C03A75B|nr:hepatitis A virus cellular receptor 1 homolog isoform X2 [Melanotaenia boesemani]